MKAKQQLLDPVCGMEVNQDSPYKAGFEGKTYYFCSDEDRKMFQDRPSVYARRDAKGIRREAPQKNDPDA